MQDPKIRLSPEESALIREAGWILTKRSAQEKVGLLMEFLARDFGERARAWDGWPEEVRSRLPKIAKGENYLGLPYCMLDFPAYFNREDVFAIRTFFWWGHYFSLTLHLKGRFKEEFLPVVLPGLSALSAGWHVGVGADEWVHAVRVGDYVPVGSLGPGSGGALVGRQQFSFDRQPHFKLAITCPLTPWDEVQTFLGEEFGELVRLLSNSLAGERGL